MRGLEDQVGLDLTGVTFYPIAFKGEAIRGGYYKEVEELIKREFKGAKGVSFFDHPIRSVCHHCYSRYIPIHSIVDDRRRRSPLRARIRCADRCSV